MKLDTMSRDIPEAKVIYMPEDTVIDSELVQELISGHNEEIYRVTVLNKYYRGYAPIMERAYDNPKKPNNKLVHPFPSMITDMLTGMFIGQPVRYTVEDKFSNDLETIQEILDISDEQDENFEIAKWNSITGRAYEYIFLDANDEKIKMNELDPRNVIYIYDNTVTPRPLFAIYFSGEGSNREAQVFGRNTDYIFTGENLSEVEEKTHNLGVVKIVESMNNNERSGDFEKVLSLINAYNRASSNTANDFDEFTDAILVIIGMLNTDEEDLKQIKEERAINIRQGQGVEWLTKTMNTEASEQFKTRLDKDIHRFTKIPNLNDEQFAGNSSGVALQYKLLALQQAIAAKARKFKRFLQDRFEVIIALLGSNVSIKHTDITIIFNPNIPIDEKANVEMVEKLIGIVSKETALAKLHGLDDVASEMQKIEDETNAYVERATMYLSEDEEVDLNED